MKWLLLGVLILAAGCGATNASSRPTPSAARSEPAAQASKPSAPAPVPLPTVAAPAPAALTVHITGSTYGHVAATTTAGATCAASATLPSGATSTAAWLPGSKTAGLDGVVVWDYRTTTRTTMGTGTHIVICQLNGKTARASATFTV